MPKISVIIPVYNAEKYLPQCLDSICNQTLSDIEIICIDDGSTDNSPEILQRYAAADKRFIIINQKNAGAGAARNKGLDIACGEYLSFLDADDFFETTMLETSFEQCKLYQSDICVFRSDYYCGAKKECEPMTFSIRSELLPKTIVFSPQDIKKNVFRVFIGWAWDKLFRTRFIRESNFRFHEQRTNNDMAFVFSAIACAKKITVCDKILAHYRKTTGSSLSETIDKSWQCFYTALLELRKCLINKNLFEFYRVDYLNYALFFCLWNLNNLKGNVVEQLYNQLKENWFKELQIDTLSQKDFYHQYEYKQYLKIMCTPFNESQYASSHHPSILSKLILCYREHGLPYTIQFILYKLN